MEEKWLSMVDKSKITKYLNRYLEDYSGVLPKFFWEDWAKAKNQNPKFRELFKDSLKIKQKINFNLPISQRTDDPEYTKMRFYLSRLIDALIPNFMCAEYNDKILRFFRSSSYNSKEWGGLSVGMLSRWFLTDFIKADGKLEITEDSRGTWYLYDTQNARDGDEPIFKIALRDGERANKGFKRLARLIGFNEEIMDCFEQLEIARSMLIQTSKMSATLVLSIDPEDFLTASDNNLNWDSCFNITENGCYKNGTYSAMVSPGIAIAYLESDKPYDPLDDEDKTFSNKIWRAWVYVDENIFYIAKNYPFKNEPVISFLYNWLISTSSDVYVSSKDAKLELCIDYSFMYDDHKMDDLFYIRNDAITSDYYLIKELSIAPNCLYCGRSLEDNCRDGAFVCYDCDDVDYCECCGEPIHRDEAYYIDDMPYCHCCYEDEIERLEEEKRERTRIALEEDPEAYYDPGADRYC